MTKNCVVTQKEAVLGHSTRCTSSAFNKTQTKFHLDLLFGIHHKSHHSVTFRKFYWSPPWMYWHSTAVWVTFPNIYFPLISARNCQPLISKLFPAGQNLPCIFIIKLYKNPVYLNENSSHSSKLSERKFQLGLISHRSISVPFRIPGYVSIRKRTYITTIFSCKSRDQASSQYSRYRLTGASIKLQQYIFNSCIQVMLQYRPTSHLSS